MRSTAAIALLAIAVSMLSACGGGDDGNSESRAAACTAPTPVADTSGLGALPLGTWGTVTVVERKRGFVGAQAISEIQIVELFPQMVRLLGEKGYAYLGGENEGFEAELAFSDPKKNFVSFALRETDCPSQILIRVLIEKGRSSDKGGG